MLVVLAIIGILLGLGIPAVTTLMRSGGLGAASREVSNSLSLARQFAITQRTNVRVVFPYAATGITDTIGGTNLAPLYLSYSVAASNVNAGLGDIAAGKVWIYKSKWELLPLGAVFMSSNPSPSTVNAPALDNLGTASMPFPYTNSAFATLAYIEFNPTGAASQSGTFTITEGVMNGGTVTPTSKNISGTTLANVVTVSVDNIVGHIKVSRP